MPPMVRPAMIDRNTAPPAKRAIQRQRLGGVLRLHREHHRRRRELRPGSRRHPPPPSGPPRRRRRRTAPGPPRPTAASPCSRQPDSIALPIRPQPTSRIGGRFMRSFGRTPDPHSSWPGSYGGFVVKGDVTRRSPILSWVCISNAATCRCVSHPGRPLWLRPIGLQARIRWNAMVPNHDAPFAGPMGPGRAGPILTAACRSHSPARRTAHPGGLSGFRWRSPSACFSSLDLRIASLSAPALRRRRSARRPAPRRSRRSATTPPAACGQALRP